MAQNLQLDPEKRDYVVVQGSPVPTDRVLEPAYFAMMIPEGKWLYGAVGQGSQINTLQNVKRRASIEQLYAQYADAAVKRQLVDTGIAEDVQTVNLQATRTATVNQTSVVPSASQVSSQFDFVPV